MPSRSFQSSASNPTANTNIVVAAAAAFSLSKPRRSDYPNFDDQGFRSSHPLPPFPPLLRSASLQSVLRAPPLPSLLLSEFGDSLTGVGQGARLVIQDQFNDGGAGNSNTVQRRMMASVRNHLGGNISSLYSSNGSSGGLPQNSATALLLKAAQMGSTSSNQNGTSALRPSAARTSLRHPRHRPGAELGTPPPPA